MLFKNSIKTKDEFLSVVKGNYPTIDVSDEGLSTLYSLLMARYMNSSIASEHEEQFKLKLAATTWMHAPTWWKRVGLQSEVRSTTGDELYIGAKTIYNHAANPNTVPSALQAEELQTIDDQNTSINKKDKLRALTQQNDALVADVTESLLRRYVTLFKKLVDDCDTYPTIIVKDIIATDVDFMTEDEILETVSFQADEDNLWEGINLQRDAALITGNIRQGVQIYGVDGSLIDYTSDHIELQKAIEAFNTITGNQYTGGEFHQNVLDWGTRAFSAYGPTKFVYLGTEKDPNGSIGLRQQANSGDVYTTRIYIPYARAKFRASTFEFNTRLQRIDGDDLGEITGISGYCFYECTSLSVVDIKSPYLSVSSWAFSNQCFGNCRALQSLVIRKSDAVALLYSTDAFEGTPIATSTTSGYIYVPDNLVNAYKAASNWSQFASKIRALSTYGG